MGNKKTGKGKTVKRKALSLSECLILNEFICEQLGYSNFAELRNLCLNVKDGYDVDNHSFIYKELVNQNRQMKITQDKLREYDENIFSYLKKININRHQPLILKYYQYLAALFSEIYLDMYFNDPVRLLNNLQEFANNKKIDFVYGLDDLRKVAFWMATGSGKTHIFHLNYYQFLKYNKGKNQINYNNILLITPTEILSQQHMEELKKAGIPYQSFDNFYQGFQPFKNPDVITVIEIHKLTENKKGGGISIDIEDIGTKNLIFVDEGHKGCAGKKWREYREKIAQDGWAFEYSATFGQATTNNKELLEEYGKSILFDYSYKFFYTEGYGKDFEVVNLTKESYDHTNTLMLVALLTYYEQLVTYQTKFNEIKEYNFEKPLWVFVGSKVSDKTQRSDIMKVIDFLAKFLHDKNWVISTMRNMFENGSSGLFDATTNLDLFSPDYPETKLKTLKNMLQSKSPEEYEKVYNDIINRVFLYNISSQSPPNLRIVDISGGDGEIGLKLGTAGKYFALITIGDKRDFLKDVEKILDKKQNTEKKYPNIVDYAELDTDKISSSLFEHISKREDEDSLNILIGAKKFLEGWDCWRVSTMGLLHVGQREGTQIIQLFGRGVRLKGKNYTLKRSTFVDPSPPDYISVLETLRIFGVEANYMDIFKQQLQIEDIPVSKKLQLPLSLPLRVNKITINQKPLKIPKFEIGDFKNENIELELDDQIKPEIDLLGEVVRYGTLSQQAIHAQTQKQSIGIPKNCLDLVDWVKIYFEIEKYKQEREWFNLIIKKETLKDILDKCGYDLYADANKITLKSKSFEDIAYLEDAIISILTKYVRMFYTKKMQMWATKNISLDVLQYNEKKHPNLAFSYSFCVDEKKRDVQQRLNSLLQNPTKVYGKFEDSGIANVYFDRHLYQPLLICINPDISIMPTGLNEGEKKFIEDLKEYYEKLQMQDLEIYVLRNLPRRGVGFFCEDGMFYPDFLVWIVYNNKQYLIFVDPKGLVHLTDSLGKVNFTKEIKDLAHALLQSNTNSTTDLPLVGLDAYIISQTEYNNICNILTSITGKTNKDDIERDWHILFKEDKDYIEKMLKNAISVLTKPNKE
ncbi:MAG: DEAD/DEAH box helicase family protein [Thermoplasmata archaeon]